MAVQIYKMFVKNTFFYFISGLIANLSLFLINVILARLLGKDSYAIIVLLTSVAGIAIVISNFGISDATTKFVAEQQDKKKIGELISSGITFFIFTSLLATLALFLFSDILSKLIFKEECAAYIKLSSLWVFSFAFIIFIRAVGMGLHKTPLIIFGSLLCNPPRLAYIVALLLVGVSLARVVIGWTVIAAFILLLGVAVFLLYLRRQKIRLGPPSYTVVKKIVKYGAYLYVPFLSIFITRYVLVLLLGAFSSKQEVSFFAVSLSLTTVSFLLFMPVSKILMPTVSRIYKSDNRATLETAGKVLTKYIGVISLLITSVFCFGSALILRTIYGSGYVDAARVLIVLAIAVFFETYKVITDPFLIGTEHARAVSRIEILRLFIIMASSYFLIKYYGALGGAFAFLTGTFISCILKLRMVNIKLTIKLYREAIKVFILFGFLAVSLVLGINFFVFSITAILFIIFFRLVSIKEIKAIYLLLVSR